ncbi:MAG: glycine oxidase ThiO [Gemmatimonadales bacterium]|nr:MAG: glycine oxidase ThiO [Gemmatimonadales bacterium]
MSRKRTGTGTRKRKGLGPRASAVIPWGVPSARSSVMVRCSWTRGGEFESPPALTSPGTLEASGTTPQSVHRMRLGKTADDVVVAGGGLVGMAVALEAARRGLRVRVLDRSTPGAGATQAAAGMLSPLSESSDGGPFLSAGLASLRLYPGWIDALRAVSEVDPRYRRDGKLRVACAPPALRGLAGLARRAREFGLSAAPIDGEDLARLAGTRVAPPSGALLLAEDHQVDNRCLHRAVSEGARRTGVAVTPDAEVVAVVVERGRAIGVRLAGGDLLRAGAVVLAAGAWTGGIPGIPFPLPVRPVRGQMLALDARDSLPARVIESEDVYLVPRWDGRLLVGATVEEVGFDSGCTAEAGTLLRDAAIRLLPGLATAPVLDHWHGFRPGTPDAHPIIGTAPGVEGLYMATGHFRNGILLAPWTAEALGRLLAGGDGPEIPEAFLPDRFQRSPEDGRRSHAPNGG